MNKLIAAALFSTVFITPAFAEDAPSMADLHSTPAAWAPGRMQGLADQAGECDSKEHGARGPHGQYMMDNQDDCDNEHGMGKRFMMGGEESDCDAVHAMGNPGMMDMQDDGWGSRRGMGGRYAPGMGGDPYGYGMMGGPGGTMMMEPNMSMLGGMALSDEQHAKITEYADELKHKNWNTQGLINDETAKLRDLYEADRRDPAAIGKEYQKVFDLKRKMIENYLETQNSIEAVLTPEQRAQMKQARRGMRGMYGHHMH